MEELHAPIRVCPRCRLCQTRTHAVPGIGTSRAEVVFVGEGPGRTEDREGRPFVGRAGQFLDEMLAAIGLRRGDVYITNIVKCRPTAGDPPYGNRAPRPDEISACAPWLEAQLAAIRPRLVCALGRVPTGYFLPGAKLSKVRGRLQHRGDLPVLPLFHPAVALYRQDKRAVLMSDFRKIVRILDDLRKRDR
ncbi:MAG: uracil-DNA glycosylase [Armatimonadetes bacterium]|nr:uracil-DNA glycosylase [Armatimonadota bacterium]